MKFNAGYGKVGYGGNNRVIGTYCGQQPGRSVLSDDTVAVLFSHWYLSGQYRGFPLSFSFLSTW